VCGAYILLSSLLRFSTPVAARCVASSIAFISTDCFLMSSTSSTILFDSVRLRLLTSSPSVGRRHRHIAACFGTAVLLLPVAVSAQTRSTATASAAALARAGDAVVTIIAYRSGTTDVTSGTGFRVPDGRIVTALRHLRGASRVEIFGADGDLLDTSTGIDQADVKLDLAVFPRAALASAGERVTLARRSASLTQRVNVLGPRKGTTRSVAERTVSHVEPDENGRPLLRLGAAVPAGAAGSPVVNARSELVAIALGSMPGREDTDFALDVSALREFLARPAARLAFPSRDGTLAAARPAAATDPKAVTPVSNPRTPDASTRPRNGSVFPERYGAPVAADTAGVWAVELFGCVRLESRRKAYCYLRVTNLSRGATFTVSGSDFADSTNRKTAEAENLLTPENSQRIAGWRNKAEIQLRELESARLAVEFGLPARDSDATRLILDVAGERTLFFGPFVLQRAP
jgi:hypothetical protein